MQCHKFHEISEFDKNKRSCRVKLQKRVAAQAQKVSLKIEDEDNSGAEARSLGAVASPTSVRVGRRRVGKAPASGGPEGGISGGSDYPSVAPLTGNGVPDMRLDGCFPSLPDNFQTDILANLREGFFPPMVPNTSGPRADEKPGQLPGLGFGVDMLQKEQCQGGPFTGHAQQLRTSLLRFPKVDAGQLRSMSGFGNNRMSSPYLDPGGRSDSPVSMRPTGFLTMHTPLFTGEPMGHPMAAEMCESSQQDQDERDALEAEQLRQMMKVAQEKIRLRGAGIGGRSSGSKELPEQLELLQRTGLQLKPSPLKPKEDAAGAASGVGHQPASLPVGGEGLNRPQSIGGQSMDWNAPGSLNDLIREDLDFDPGPSSWARSLATAPECLPGGQEGNFPPDWVQVGIFRCIGSFFVW